jgi:hypothetical protein
MRNYFTAGAHPFNLACVPPQALAVLSALELPPPADHMSDGPVLGPAEVEGLATPIHAIGDNTPWIDFDGFWGELQWFHAPSDQAEVRAAARASAC